VSLFLIRGFDPTNPTQAAVREYCVNSGYIVAIDSPESSPGKPTSCRVFLNQQAVGTYQRGDPFGMPTCIEVRGQEDCQALWNSLRGLQPSGMLVNLTTSTQAVRPIPAGTTNVMQQQARRTLSTAARKRIATAQKKRWAATRPASTATKAPTTAKQKPKTMAAGA
jgi:hypothetical protein